MVCPWKYELSQKETHVPTIIFQGLCSAFFGKLNKVRKTQSHFVDVCWSRVFPCLVFFSKSRNQFVFVLLEEVIYCGKRVRSFCQRIFPHQKRKRSKSSLQMCSCSRCLRKLKVLQVQELILNMWQGCLAQFTSITNVYSVIPICWLITATDLNDIFSPAKLQYCYCTFSRPPKNDLENQQQPSTSTKNPNV